MGQPGLAEFCRLGWDIPGHTMSACGMAYLYDRGHTEDALRFAKTASQHDDDVLQCQNELALFQRAVGDNPRHWEVGDAWEVAAAK